MSTTTKSDHILLLDAFRIGLRFRLVTMEQVVLWANEIIKNDPEPDDFFVTLAQSRDENRLLWFLIKNAPFTASIIPTRVIIGIAFYKLAQGEISPEKFSNICEELPYGSTSIEYAMIKEIVSYSTSFPDGRFIGIISGRWPMLSHYKDLNLSNDDKWLEIDSSINGEIEKLQAKADKKSERVSEYRNERKATLKQKKYIALTVVSLFVLLVIAVDYQLLTNHKPVKILGYRLDEYEVWEINVACGLFLTGICYTVWKIKRRRR